MHNILISIQCHWKYAHLSLLDLRNLRLQGRAFFKPERQKDISQSILICSFVSLRFAIRFDRSIKGVMIMYAKLIRGMKMKTADHGVTAPLIPWPGRLRPWFLVCSPSTGGRKWSEYEVKVPSLPRPCLRGGEGEPGVSNDLCISPKTSGPTWRRQAVQLKSLKMAF